MGKKDAVQIVQSKPVHQHRKDTLVTLVTLASWRLRQTWLQLLMTGVALLASCTIACIPPLFSTVADTAGLQELFSASPARTTLALNMNADTISSATVAAAFQRFEKVIRPGLGSYLDAEPAQRTISMANLVITQPARLKTINPLHVYATSIQHIRSSLQLVQGRWANEQMTNGAFEVMLSTTTAQTLGLTIGTTLTLQSGFVTKQSIFPADRRAEMAVRLVGTFANPADDAPGLHGETFQPVTDYTGASYVLLMSDTAFLQACDQIAARENSPTVSSAEIGTPFRLNWYYHLRTDQLQFGQIDVLTSRLASVQRQIASSPLNGAHSFPYVRDATIINPTSANVDLLTLLSQYVSQVSIVNLPVALLAWQTIALLLFFACLLMNQLIDRQMTMSAQLSSRGASTRQVTWSLLAQGAGLCVLALVLGPLLGSLLIYKLAAQLLPENVLVAQAGLFDSPGQILALVAPYLVGTFLVGLLAIGLPCRRASNVNMLELRREATRASIQPFWLRYYLDLLMALLALSGFGVALYLAQVARDLDLRTQELVIAPLTLVTPLFLLLGGLLLFLRLFPLILRIALRLARQARGITTVLALAQMVRHPRQATRLIMLLTLAASFASFALIFSASQNQRALDIAAFESGADFSGTLPAEFVAQTQLALAFNNQSKGELSQRIQQAVALQYSKIPGVRAASVGYNGSGTGTGLGDVQTPIVLHAVDMHTFAGAASWGSQDSSQSLGSLIHQLLQYQPTTTTGLVIPAIVDETTLSNLHLMLGNVFDVSLNLGNFGNGSISFRVVEVVPHIPGVNGSAGMTGASSAGGILVDYQVFSQVYLNYQVQVVGVPAAFVQPLAPNYAWLRTGDSPTGLASVRATLSSSSLALSNLYDRREIGADLQHDPLIFSILLLLSLGGIIALILAFLGNLLASWLNVRLRLQSFVVLRALGASRRQVVSILLWEQGIVYLAAIVMSLPLGGVLAWLVVPKLVFTGLPTHGTLSEMSADQFYLLQQALPPQVIIPSALQLAWPTLVLIGGLALLLMARMVSRASYGQELRLNED